MSSILRAYTLTTEENEALNAAAAALKLSRSELVQHAVVAMGYRHRIFTGAALLPPPRNRVWRDATGRMDSSCSVRTSVTFSAVTYSVLDLLSAYIGLSESRVVAGAVYRYIAELQKHPFTLTAQAAQEAKLDLEALAAIPVPAKYLS